VPKLIPHKKLVLFLSFLSFTFNIYATSDFKLKKDGTAICSGASVTMSVEANSNYQSYQWWVKDPIAGWTQRNTTPSFNTQTPGKFCLVITDITNKPLYSDTITLALFAPPAVPVITSSPTPNVYQICQGASLTLVTTSVSSLYDWNFNGKQVLGSQQVKKWTATEAGEYTLKVTDINGCSSKSLPYKIDYSSVIILKIDSVAPFCSVNASPINLVATPASGIFNNKNSGKGIIDRVLGTFDPKMAGLGKHEVSYEYPDAGGCGTLTTKRTIIVSEPKPVITTNTGKNQFCVGDIATLSVMSDMKKYDWYKDGNPTPVGVLSKLDIGAGGKFTVKIIEKESLCEKTSPEVNIEFASAVNPTIATIPSGCGTNFPTVPLSGSPSGGTFTINGAFATTFDYKKMGFGKHKVVYTLSGTLPCLQGSSEQEVEIQDFPKPDLGSDIFLGSGNSVTLRGFIDANLTYSWSPTTGLDNAVFANPVASPTTTQEYTLTATTSLGCSGTGKVNVVVYEPIYIPTAFTPNGDATNDTWELRGLENYPNSEVQIFNRWGNTIFYSKGIYQPFDGKDSNNALPEGIYVYKINPFPDRPTFQFKGTFTLLR
jgi:gliding motility-associated-like protein